MATTVHVELIDAVTREQLGEADLPIDQLPESFAISTTLHLGNGDWHVEEADPVTRLEFAASGHLRLVLRKIEHVDPKTILFSLPTLENALPPLVPGDAADALTLHEDDWRQVELVSSSHAIALDAELAAIRDVKSEREHEGIPGYRRLHVRERIPHPLAPARIPLDDIATALGSPSRRAVAVHDRGSLVESGFAFAAGDGAIYGRAEHEHVVALCIFRDASLAPLVELARTHELVLGDWCATQILRPGPRGFV